MKTILFLLVAIRVLNILMYFPVMAGEILYCSPVNLVCSPNKQMVAIWKLWEDEFT